MIFEAFSPPTLHKTTGYAHAVRMGDLVFISGQVAMAADGTFVGSGDVRAQTEQIFSNLQLALEAAGSRLDRVGKLTILALDAGSRDVVVEIRNRLWADAGYTPASTFAVVSALASPEMLVEIEAVAAVG